MKKNILKRIGLAFLGCSLLTSCNTTIKFNTKLQENTSVTKTYNQTTLAPDSNDIKDVAFKFDTQIDFGANKTYSDGENEVTSPSIKKVDLLSTSVYTKPANFTLGQLTYTQEVIDQVEKDKVNILNWFSKDQQSAYEFYSLARQDKTRVYFDQANCSSWSVQVPLNNFNFQRDVLGDETLASDSARVKAAQVLFVGVFITVTLAVTN